MRRTACITEVLCDAIDRVCGCSVVYVLLIIALLCAYAALAARALGLIVVHDHELSIRLRMESEELVDALLQIVNFCRHSRVQNADTRRIHVNCCLVISLVMQGTRQQTNAPIKSYRLCSSRRSYLLFV